jgi:hypothetical protein
VCDFRASHALGIKNHGSLRYFVAYLAACRELAARYGVSLRDFDRANWQWSKDQTKNKMKNCEGWCWANEGGLVLAPMGGQVTGADVETGAVDSLTISSGLTLW